jgi:hypothetical protein
MNVPFVRAYTIPRTLPLTRVYAGRSGRLGALGYEVLEELPVGRFRLRSAAVAVVAALAVIGVLGASSASGSTGAEAALASIVRAHSTRYAPAVASRILDTGSGKLAVVAYFSRKAGHSYTLVYRYGAGRWRLLTRVNPGFAGSPDPRYPPLHVQLTGATDFAVAFETANVSTVAIVSDVGGRWHAVPFKYPHIPEAPADNTLVQLYAGPPAKVISAGEITSGYDDCNPACSDGTIHYVTWAYDVGARAFEPAPKPGPPSSIALTPVPVSATTQTPDHQTVAYFTTALPTHGSLTAADFRASVAWGDGQSSSADVELSARAPAGFRGPRRVLEFEVDATHTYTTTKVTNATVTVTNSSGAALGTTAVSVSVLTLDPTAAFYANPSAPAEGALTLLVPEHPSPTQRPVTSWSWRFGDGSAGVLDSPASQKRYLKLLRKLKRRPGDQALHEQAAQLGIIPPIQSPYSSGLSPGKMAQIATAWLYFFPRHVVPHVFTNAGSVPVSLQTTDTAGASSTAANDLNVTLDCSQWDGGFLSTAGHVTTCQTLRAIATSARAFQAFATGAKGFLGGPRRQPDYMSYAIAGGEAVVGGTVSIAVTRDHSVFVSVGGGVGLSFKVPLDISVAQGFVGLPYLPRGSRPPSDSAIDAFVDGWTIPVEVYATRGFGEGAALIFSPSAHQAGEEYQLVFGLGAGIGIQESCAVDLGKIGKLAQLAPGGHHPKSTIVTIIHHDLHTLLAQASSLISQSAVCSQGPYGPEAALFGEE